VLGVEGDVGWADNKTTLGGIAVPAFFCCATSSFASSVRTTWDASLRGRIGYLVTPGFLAYLTGGIAWQHFEENSSCGPPFCAPALPVTFLPFSFTNAFTKAGWTVGGGIEAMLWPSWLVRAGYRYAEFGTVTPGEGSRWASARHRSSNAGAYFTVGTWMRHVPGSAARNSDSTRWAARPRDPMCA
jgi:outer membrane immunogenic protein